MEDLPEYIPPRSLDNGELAERMLRAELPPLPEPLSEPIYDNHTHLDLAAKQELNPKKQLELAESVGVKGIVQVGTDLETSIWSAKLAAVDSRVLAAVALHPNEAPVVGQAGNLAAQLDQIAELASLPRVVAIGETGLDFYYTDETGQSDQYKSFETHIDIARQFGLALQIHDRDAHREILETVDRIGHPDRVVMHCFSGDAEFAEACAARGWYISFSGTVTFKNAKYLSEALRTVPKSRILVETDAPFLTPHPYRGKPNSAYMSVYTLRAMADVLNMSADELAAQTRQNTEAAYGSWLG